MTHRERIEFLLTHYLDVINGIYPDPTRDGGVQLMCRSWNSPAYQQLEKLRLRLRREQPTLHWHLAATYFNPDQRRTAYCPNCPTGHQHHPPAQIGRVHRHGRRSVPLVPRIQRMVDPLVKPDCVATATGWIELRWRGKVEIPADLQPLAGLEEKGAKVA